MLCVSKDIPSNLLATKNKLIERLYVELDLRSNRWVISCSYNSHINTINTHLDKLSESLHLFSLDCDKVIMLKDFNVEDNGNRMKSFCKNYGSKNLIKQHAKKIQVILNV